MNILETLWGEEKDLNALQMGIRAVVFFLIALVLIRLSGRRSFGISTPVDNIIVILLGALLSRAIVGASPFLPIVAASLLIVLIHRLLAWLLVNKKRLSKLVEGDKILLYEKGRFLKENMKKALVCQEDILQGVRKSALTEDLNKINRVYMERNGEISVIEKDK